MPVVESLHVKSVQLWIVHCYWIQEQNNNSVIVHWIEAVIFVVYWLCWPHLAVSVKHFLMSVCLSCRQWCIAKNGGGYTQRGVVKGLKVPCLFMITEVSIRCPKNPGGWYMAYTRVYPPIHHCLSGIYSEWLNRWQQRCGQCMFRPCCARANTLDYLRFTGITVQIDFWAWRLDLV